MKKLMIIIVMVLSTFLFTQHSFSGVVNVDFESDETDPTYNGDQGVLSNAGGDYWNDILFDEVGQISLLDEYGDGTNVDIEVDQSFVGTYTDGDATNDLQDTGLAGNGFSVLNLVQGQLYNLAVYVGPNTGFMITDISGNNFGGSSGTGQTYNLPGLINQDYVLINGLEPFDTGGGVYGLQVNSLDGLITGIQISGDIPLPPLPTCDIQMSQPIYITGETVTASVFSISNPDTIPVAVEWKVWLETPSGIQISIINIGADGTFVLPPGFVFDAGPLSLFPADLVTPGTYELNSRVLEPVTGELQCEDYNDFDIQ